MAKGTGSDAVTEHLTSALALRLRPRSGARDAALFDIAQDTTQSRAQRVTGALEAAFHPPERAPSAPGWARHLSIPDRQIALMRLALDHGNWPAWFVAECEACAAPIDLRVHADEFTATEARLPTPRRLRVEGPGGPLSFSVPTGAEEEALSGGPPGMSLLTLCGLPREADPEDWDAALSAALAPVLPTIRAELRFACPECQAGTGWWFDPLSWIARHTRDCFADVDLLARRYGWSEAEIMALPTARRRVYLSMAGAGA